MTPNLASPCNTQKISKLHTIHHQFLIPHENVLFLMKYFLMLHLVTQFDAKNPKTQIFNFSCLDTTDQFHPIDLKALSTSHKLCMSNFDQIVLTIKIQPKTEPQSKFHPIDLKALSTSYTLCMSNSDQIVLTFKISQNRTPYPKIKEIAILKMFDFVLSRPEVQCKPKSTTIRPLSRKFVPKT